MRTLMFSSGRVLLLGLLVTLLLSSLTGCSTDDGVQTLTIPSEATISAPVQTPEVAAGVTQTITKDSEPPNATATATPANTREPLPIRYPLSVPGPYEVGRQNFEFVDTARDDRQVEVAIWYPALPDQGYRIGIPVVDATPDLSGAPYPLLLSASKSGRRFAEHLASHGFVAAGLRDQDASTRWDQWLVDYPLDILFALENIAGGSLNGLEEIIDSDHAGALGYSFDGYNALALSGARIDPEFYFAKCAEAENMQRELSEWWIRYICDLVEVWDEFEANAGEELPSGVGGLWKPLTDERIKAVMPLAPEGAWLFGDRGLAAADRPVLIIAAAEDRLNYYDLEAIYIYEHLGGPDPAMITFLDEAHMMIEEEEPTEIMQHFATAFFGYHLMGREEWAEFFSKDFVERQEELAWGVVSID